MILEEDFFLSPAMCDNVHEYDIISLIKSNFQIVYDKFEELFDVRVKDLKNISYQTYKTSYSCDGYEYKTGWKRVNTNAYTGIIFLSNYKTTPPFNPHSDIYGGVLSFKTWPYKFTPLMGKLIIFPSEPNYLYKFSPVQIGFDKYLKFNITTY